ncbi:hypothetical protein KKH23_04740 [Patescibacteria group bacterium]|nr:hypothetical protein [Patescibacteria group bacterium]
MSEQRSFTKGEGRAWIQTRGPGTPFVYFGCVGVGDISAPEGEVTLVRCPSRHQTNTWDVVRSYKGEAGPVTTTLDSLLFAAQNYLLDLNCPFGLQIRMGMCTRPDVPTAWEKILHLDQSQITTRTINAPVARDSADQGPVTTSAPISAENLIIINRVDATQEIVDAGYIGIDWNDVSMCDAPSCGGDCGPFSPGCTVGWAVGGTGSIIKHIDETAQWYAWAPPAEWAADDIVAVCCSGDFVILVSGTDDEIAWSDDGGATWNVVTTGFSYAATLADCYMLGPSAIWVVGGGGYVFFSDDNGMTWETQDAGVATGEDLAAIHFADAELGYAVGANGAVIKTDNGGETWTATATPDAAANMLCVWVLNKSVVYVGDDTGDLWQSTDGGDTWTAVFSLASGSVNGICLSGNVSGFIAVDDTDGLGRIYRTVDGGSSWYRVDMPTNNGLNAVFCCDENTFVSAGDAGAVFKGESVS